jgi:general secretion pathway protein B
LILSILLEALRKSEKNKHPQEVPDIHTADQSAPVSESIQPGPLALLLVAALFASGWFIWDQYRPPAESSQPSISQTKNKVSAVNAPVASPQAGAARIATVIPASPVAGKPGGKLRTPVESYQQEVSETVLQQPDKPRPPAKNTPSDGVVKSRENPPATGTLAAARQAAVVRKKNRPREPALITYWELPDAVRADVAEIKFTVLVYDQDPRLSFVLINGKRLGEGDSSQPGLVVEEIRRDGVVFSYRLYRFLVER